uniref:Uncharacterized protein n=1 Tax=Amphimedon queenslandica TaxID=400682 RepID=A0A1X7TBT0_AMPQE
MMLQDIVIWFTPLPHDCIQCLCQILSSSKTIRRLCIIYYSIGDKGVISLCQAIVQNCNSTLSRLDLSYNPLITSACAQALCELILATDRIWGIDLRVTMMSSESVLLLLQALSANKSVRRLMLDVKHKKIFTETYTEYHPMMERLVFAGYYSYDYL